MKKLTAGAVIALALATAGYYLFFKKEAALSYRTEKLTRGEIVSGVTASGAINAVKTVQVGAQVSGIISRLHVDFNSRVRKGEIIAEIDPALFQAQMEQARAALVMAEANTVKAQASLAQAAQANKRATSLSAQGIISTEDREAAEANLDSAAAQVGAAKAAAEQQKAALSMAKANLDYTRITAPVDGVVIYRAVDEGQTVAASFQTPTLFTIAADLTKMQIDANVNEADIGRVREGMKGAFTVDAFPGEPFEGVVAQVRNSPLTLQNVVTYDVVIRVDNSSLKLRPGMTANVSIVTIRKESVLKAPNAALRFRPPGMKKEREPEKPGKPGIGLWIMEKGEPRRIKIKTGAGDGTYTEAISDELKEGMEVILDTAGGGKKSQSPPGGGPRLY